MKLAKWFLLLFSVSAFAQSGLTVRNVDPRPESNSAIAMIINKSEKDIVAYSLSVDSIYKNGVTIHSRRDADIGPLAVEKGNALHPGAFVQENFYGAFDKIPMTVTAKVIMVIYTDDTADVFTDEGGEGFKDVMKLRRAIAAGFSLSAALIKQSLESEHPLSKASDAIKSSMVTSKIKNQSDKTTAGFLADTVAQLNSLPAGQDERLYAKNLLAEKQHQVTLYSRAVKVAAIYRGEK